MSLSITYSSINFAHHKKFRQGSRLTIRHIPIAGFTARRKTLKVSLSKNEQTLSDGSILHTRRDSLLIGASASVFGAVADEGSTTAAAVSGGKNSPKIGFIGLGIMGLPMALNLMKAGYQVTVWNRTAEKCKPAVSAGAFGVKSAKEVVEASDITFAMLSDPEAALAVVDGKQGVVAGMSSGKGYVDVSTVDADTARTISQKVQQAGGVYLEAPVSGSKKPAEDGLLIFLTAGNKELYDRVVPMLDVMGKANFFLGDVGKGAQMKLVVNMVMGSMMAAFSEGLELSKKSGLDQNTLLEVISLGAISSPMFSLKGPSMVKGNFPTAFPLKHQQKDLRLALELGEELNQPLPVAEASNGLYKSALTTLDLGDSDFSAVIKAVQEVNIEREN